MQIHSVDSDNDDLLCAVWYVDPVTSCVWTIVHNSRIWMACAPHDSKNRELNKTNARTCTHINKNKNNYIEVKHWHTTKKNNNSKLLRKIVSSDEWSQKMNQNA